MKQVNLIMGIGKVYMARLNELGIRTVEDLLDQCRTKQDRHALAERSGFTDETILTWANHADLFRINGVAGQYADLLEAAGVNTVPEMAMRNAENLTARMEEINREKHLEEIRKVTKIDDVKNRLIRNLSKGYRQRVGIAQALVGNPPVIIFDEPTVGLDPKQIIEIRNLIRSLGKNHTVVLSTHILSEVQSVCDRIIIINEGKIIADEKTENITQAVDQNRRWNVKIAGPQREVLAALGAIPGVTSVELTGERELDSYVYRLETERNADVRKPLFYAMAEKNWPILGLEAVGMNLEEVFVRITERAGNR